MNIGKTVNQQLFVYLNGISYNNLNIVLYRYEQGNRIIIWDVTREPINNLMFNLQQGLVL